MHTEIPPAAAGTWVLPHGTRGWVPSCLAPRQPPAALGKDQRGGWAGQGGHRGQEGTRSTGEPAPSTVLCACARAQALLHKLVSMPARVYGCACRHTHVCMGMHDPVGTLPTRARGAQERVRACHECVQA